jgi:hypothetical protein
MALNTYADLQAIPRADARAVIINCGTKWVTLLAVLSAHRYTGLPIVVIDCESADGSKDHIDRVTRNLGIDVDCVDWPLRPHPIALDAVFTSIPADRVLLMDSDLEILSPSPFKLMVEALDRNPDAYASGFLHGPMWIGEDHGLPAHTGYYAERMWIPFTFLRTSIVRDALGRGFSFMNRRTHYEVPGAPNLSRLLARRYRVAGIKHVPLPWLGAQRPQIDGWSPRFIEFDTGADLHAQLLQEGKRFAAIPIEFWGDVAHHHGVTRARLATGMRKMAKRMNLISRKTETDLHSVLGHVFERLESQYGVAVRAS